MGIGGATSEMVGKGFSSEDSPMYRKGYHSLLADRPEIAPSDQAVRTKTRPYLALAFFFWDEVSYFSDCVSKLAQEILRNGAEWKEAYTLKCGFCGHEMHEHLDKCPVCKGTDLREPDSAQLFRWRRKDGRTWGECMNDNGQTEMQVARTFENYLEVADNAYLLCVFEYIIEADDEQFQYDRDARLIDRVPLEFINLDPRFVEKIFDRQGRPDKNQRTCLIHRDRMFTKDEKDCPICHGRLYPVAYRTLLNGSNRYYLEHEIHHSPKYNPGLLYGYPVVFKMLDDIWAFHYLEKQTRQFFERGRPNSILCVPTNNIAGTDALWRKQQEDMSKDRFYTPWLFIDPEARQPLQLLKLMDSPNPDMLAVKKDLRERMGSYMGITSIFSGDTSASGGLNNEGHQLTVTGRAAEWGQQVLNEGFYKFIGECLGITDWKRCLKPNEEKDEMAELLRLEKEVDIAQKMQALGFEAHFKADDAKICKHFSFSGEAHMREAIDQMRQPLQLDQSPEDFDIDQFKAQNPGLDYTPEGMIDFNAMNRKMQAEQTKG